MVKRHVHTERRTHLPALNTHPRRGHRQTGGGRGGRGVMEDRDENGRLRLPREDRVPFQRVLHRTHRSSRKQSPEPTITNSMGRLSLRRRKDRSGSLPEKRVNGTGAGNGGDSGGGGGGGANFIPFQRVLHRRRKTSLSQPSPPPEPRRYRERLSWESHKPAALHMDTQYNSRTNNNYYDDYRNRRPHTRKNNSQLNQLLGNQGEEEVRRTAYSRNSYTTERGSVGVESPEGGSEASVASSVKLPQIQGSSPSVAPESARSGRASGVTSALSNILEPLDS